MNLVLYASNRIPLCNLISTFLHDDQVLTAAICNKLFPRKPTNAVMNISTSPKTATNKTNTILTQTKEPPTQNTTEPPTLNFLNQAVTNNPIHQTLECTQKQVDNVKIVLKTIPIFASTIILNSCLAQLSTFSVQQAATMNTNLGPFRVPPASLPVFPVIFIMILTPLYNHIILPIARKVNNSEMGITHLQRIGMGLIMSIIAMAVASLVETKRKKVASKQGLIDSTEPLPITFLWIALQYLFLGSADLFSLAGLLEFFFSEAPSSMKSLATSFSWASLAIGYYLSSVLVEVVNRVTGVNGGRPWLKGSNLNHYHLERFYWLMCVLSGLNFLNYVFWASRYKYRSMN